MLNSKQTNTGSFHEIRYLIFHTDILLSLYTKI